MPSLIGQSVNPSDPGVFGENVVGGDGVFGNSTIGRGVVGVSTTQTGVEGNSTTADGVFGSSIGGRGIVGVADTQSAVEGKSTSGTGVFGSSTTGRGVVGVSDHKTGVEGFSKDGFGVYGSVASEDGIGIYSTVAGRQAIGIYGENKYNTGIARDGLAGKFKGNVSVSGYLEMNYGGLNIVLEHPTDPTKEIVYTAQMGSKAGTYINGTAKLVDGEAVIELPEHFSHVTDQEGLTIHLTPRGEWLQLYVVELDTRRGVVREAQSKSGEFDYIIHGERKEYKNLEVIRTKGQDVPYNSSAC